MGPLRKPDFLLFYWLHVATEEKKNPSHTRIDLSLGKVRVHQSLALSILNKHAAHRDNHLCIFFFFKWNFGKHIWQFDTDWKPQEASHTCCYKGMLQPSFCHFYTYKKVRNDPCVSAGENRIDQTAVICNVFPRDVDMPLHGCRSIRSSGSCACHFKNKLISCAPVDSNAGYAGRALIWSH